jgi:hypothetical protein
MNENVIILNNGESYEAWVSLVELWLRLGGEI